jgi:hypothetical protein
MSPPPVTVPDPSTAYVASLREVLTTLLAALEFERHMPPRTPPALRPLYDPQWAIDHAYTVLAQDTTGLAAQEEIALHMGIALTAYEFVRYLEALQARGIWHPPEIAQAMAHIQALTVQSYGEPPHEAA